MEGGERGERFELAERFYRIPCKSILKHIDFKISYQAFNPFRPDPRCVTYGRDLSKYVFLVFINKF